MTDLGNGGEQKQEVAVAVLRSQGVQVDKLETGEYRLEKGSRLWVGVIPDPSHRRFMIAQAHRFGFEARLFWNPELVEKTAEGQPLA